MLLTLCREVIPYLKALAELATKVWQTNVQIINAVIHLETKYPSPELRYTWFQEPVRFEDALGRLFPIPSEYNWGVGFPYTIM